MNKKKIMTKEPLQRFGFRKLSVGLVSALVSSTMVTNAINAHAETTTNVEKTATDESDATSSSKTVTAESGIVVDKAGDKAEGDTTDSTKDTEKAKDDQSSTVSANDESASTTESTATTQASTTDSAAEAESKVAGDTTAASKESTTEGNSQATTSEAKSDTGSIQEDQTSQASSKDDSATNSRAIDTSVASSLTTSFALPMSTKEKMEAAVNALINDAPTNAQSSVDISQAQQSNKSDIQKAIIKYVDVSTGTPVEISKDIITGKSNSWEVYTGGNQEIFLDGGKGKGNLNSYGVDKKIREYFEQGYAVVENGIPSSSLDTTTSGHSYFLFDNDSSVDQEYTISLINTNKQYEFNLVYYDIVTGQTVATKVVKSNEQIDFPVPDGYALAAPGQPLENIDRDVTLYPGIAMPKTIGQKEVGLFANNVATDTPIAVPVYNVNGVIITRTINLHKPDGTIEVTKQPVVYKNSVKSTPINPEEHSFLARNFMVMPISDVDKTYTLDTWIADDRHYKTYIYDQDAEGAIPLWNTSDTSTWSNTNIEEIEDIWDSHWGFVGDNFKFFTKYKVTVSAAKADGTDTWESYTTPTIAGYKATLDYVDPVKVKMTDSDVTVDIYYTTDTQNATVTYIDDNTGKELTSDALKGNSGAKSGYTTADKIKTYQDLGYVLVSDDTNGQEIIYDNDSSTDQKYTVHLKHGTVLINPENPGHPGEGINPGTGSSVWPDKTDKDSLTNTVNRTINYKMSDGSKAPDIVHDTLTYTANTLVDKVTGEILSTEWSPAQDFTDVTSPEVAHYVPDRTVVSNKGIAHDHADIVEEVTYTPKNEAQKAKVTYVDETTGKTLKVDDLNGTSNAKSGYTTAKSIEDYQNLGYVLVSDETSGQEVVFDDDTSKDQEYKVVLKHGYATVTGDNPGKPGEAINPDPNGAKWPDGTDKANLTEDVHRVITYRMSDSSKAPDQVENVLHFTAKKVVDKVTGEVVSTEWSAPQDFEDVASPAVKGYVADKAVVSNKDIAHDHSDIHEVVTYTPAEQKATVTYVDSLTGKTIMTKELVGKSNAASGYKTEADIKSLVDKGYVFESDETNGQEVVFDDDATVDQNYVVKLTHKFEESEETHQATRKIRLHEPDDLKVITQIGTVKRSVKIDSVTGEKTYGDWTQDKWAEFDTPALEGYTASLDKVEEKAVGGDTKDEVVDIYYNKPEEPAPAPEEPAKPAEPVPAKPAEPVPAEPTPAPEEPAKLAPEKKEAPAPAKPKEKVTTTVVTTTQAQLPQTGNKDDKVVKASGVLALGASLMATLFSSFKKKSK